MSAKNRNQKKFAFCPFTVIGDPTYKKSIEIVKLYVESGADMLELGLPFSDPTADGPVIQQADQRAIKAGMTTKLAMQFIKDVRKFTDIPIGLLVYNNMVLRYGTERFYRDAARAGANSILIADMPLEESVEAVRCAKQHGIAPIFIVSERTTSLRLRKILKHARGFLYVVSALGITGVRSSLPASLPKLIKRLKKATRLPLMVGFGISNRSQIRALQKAGADGYIVGSAIVAHTENTATLRKKLATLLA